MARRVAKVAQSARRARGGIDRHAGVSSRAHLALITIGGRTSVQRRLCCIQIGVTKVGKESAAGLRSSRMSARFGTPSWPPRQRASYTSFLRPEGGVRRPGFSIRFSGRRGQCGGARPRCARPSCRAARRATGQEPASRPFGLPSFAQHGQAGDAGVHEDGGPSRGRGSQALMSFAGTRTTALLDELARCSRTPLRFVCCARARSSPRPPAKPGAGPP